MGTDAATGAGLMLEIEDLHVSYGPVVALEGVSLSVPDRGSACLLGPNGAGKSTLLRAVSGLLGFHGGRVTSGTIRFEDKLISGVKATSLVRYGIAQVLEGRRVFPELTVADNLAAGQFRLGRRAPEGVRHRVLDLFPRLADRLRQPAGLLSGGEQQMLAIARALMSCPRLLLLDEPSLGLAPLVTRGIGEALRQINADGVTLLLVEQSRALAQSVTTEGYLIETGRIRAQGPTAALLADSQVRATYLGVRER
jgi:branched-chain amino acid transport system ATP-binding protein